MMRKATIVPAHYDHALRLAAEMRPEDREEVWLTSQRTPLEAIHYSLVGSRDPFTAFDDKGRILCMAGVVPYTALSNVATPWMLTSAAMQENKKMLLWHTKTTLELWRQWYALLENYVDARYEQSLRWARWAGFTVEEPKKYGFRGVLLHRITMEGYA